MCEDAAAVGAEAAGRLAALGTVTIDRGLSDEEFAHLEQTLGFEFADDHRAFLSTGLPVGTSWPHWRDEGRRSLTRRLQLPIDGILFGVEWKQFWGADWGPRPPRMKDALRTAKYRLARVPQLIPVHSHHYLAAGRGTYGRPVLSVVQTDVVSCGADLAGYIDHEFGAGGDSPPPASTVEFWSDLMS